MNFKNFGRQGLVLTAIALLSVVFSTGCEPECVDKYDCREQSEGGTIPQACVDGRCVAEDVPPVEEEDAGEVTDAGEETDGGETDAGEVDGGQTDGGQTDGGQTDSGTPFVDAGFERLEARMNSEQLVPPGANAGTALGIFTINRNVLTDGGYRLDWTVAATNIAANLQDSAHLHVAPGGVNNTAVAFDLGATPTAGSGTITAAFAEDLSKGRVYADIHNTAGQGGAADIVRGQLIHTGEQLFVARLNGAEAGNPLVVCANAAYGLTTNNCGGVQVVLSADGTQVSYSGLWASSVVADSSHIHVGPVGQTGANLVTLNPLADGGFGVEGGPTGLNGVNPAQLDGGYYVNVHTADAGNGLIRGQLYAP